MRVPLAGFGTIQRLETPQCEYSTRRHLRAAGAARACPATMDTPRPNAQCDPVELLPDNNAPSAPTVPTPTIGCDRPGASRVAPPSHRAQSVPPTAQYRATESA